MQEITNFTKTYNEVLNLKGAFNNKKLLSIVSKNLPRDSKFTEVKKLATKVIDELIENGLVCQITENKFKSLLFDDSSKKDLFYSNNI